MATFLERMPTTSFTLKNDVITDRLHNDRPVAKPALSGTNAQFPF